MKQRVLIVSADFFGYQNSVARAFEKIGFDTKTVTYDEPIHPFRGLLKWRHKFSHNREALRAESRAKYAVYIRSIFDSYSPRYVFIYNGTILEDDTLDYFRNHGSKVIVWMYDSVQRADRSMCISHIDHADLFCCFEARDVDFYAKQNKVAYFMPLSVDSSVYYPIGNQKKDIDILFVGTIYVSPKRIDLLERLAERYKDKNLLFYGYYKPYFKDPIGWSKMNNRSVFKNRNIAPEQVNTLFARSKIALNIHNQQTFSGANQRLFEACGACVYQICDRNPYIQSIFPNGEVGLYDDFDGMCRLIDYALSHDMTPQAEAAHEVVMKYHTFDARISEMLRLMGE